MNDLTKELDEIRARVDAATDGPWNWLFGGKMGTGRLGGGRNWREIGAFTGINYKENMELCIHSRTDVDRLERVAREVSIELHGAAMNAEAPMCDFAIDLLKQIESIMNGTDEGDEA